MQNNKFVGVVDIGSNTLKAVVYEISETEIKRKYFKVYFLKLWEKIENYILPESEIENLVSLITKIQKEIHVIFPKMLFYCFGTEAIRIIQNNLELLKKIENIENTNMQVLKKSEETQFNFTGLQYFLKNTIPAGLIIDMGGASTEFVYFENKKIVFQKSLPFGGLQLKQKFCPNRIPDQYCLHLIKKNLNKIIKAEIPIEYRELDIILVSGTFAAFAQILNNYQYTPDINMNLNLNSLFHYLDLASSGNEDTLDFILKNENERKDVFAIALTLAAIFSRFTIKKIKIINWGLREGFLLSKIS